MGTQQRTERILTLCVSSSVSLIARSRFATLCTRTTPIAPFVPSSVNYRQGGRGGVFKLTCNQSPGTSLTFHFFVRSDANHFESKRPGLMYTNHEIVSFSFLLSFSVFSFLFFFFFFCFEGMLFPMHVCK